MGIQNLQHTVRPLPGGGQVVLLNTGAEIGPEDLAMLQALYSRSPQSLFTHLKQLAQAGSGKFMETFYVGYGHKSIGDCGQITLFIEGVSMLVAKAVQDWMLYSGQECSTRYLDFGSQPFVDPLANPDSHEVLEGWREFYVTNLPLVREHVANQFPRQEGEDEKVYSKAVGARAFDIMRSFLPAGASTSLSWQTNLRQVCDKLLELRHHPLTEVQVVAEAIEGCIAEACSNSIPKRYEATEAYYDQWMRHYYLFSPSFWPLGVELCRQGVDKEQLSGMRYYLETRPPKTDLPKKMARTGTCQFRFCLDFGSYRDIQRQRAVIQMMPLLNVYFGFEDWYLESLPEVLETDVRTKILPRFVEWYDKQLDRCVPGELLQYYVPMGYRVPCEVTGDLPALVYLVELRSGISVHPTLRRRAQAMASILQNEFGECGLVLHIDSSEAGRFDTRRGIQDIVKKA